MKGRLECCEALFLGVLSWNLEEHGVWVSCQMGWHVMYETAVWIQKLCQYGTEELYAYL
jgi:hypothetical protein